MTQYARYRNNVVDIYEEGVFGSSDHNPIIVGLDAGFPEGPGEPGEPGDPGDDSPPGTGSDRPGQNPGKAPDHAGKPGKPDHAGKPGKPDHAGKPGKPDHAGRPGS